MQKESPLPTSRAETGDARKHDNLHVSHRRKQVWYMVRAYATRVSPVQAAHAGIRTTPRRCALESVSLQRARESQLYLGHQKYQERCTEYEEDDGRDLLRGDFQDTRENEGRSSKRKWFDFMYNISDGGQY